VKAAERQNCRGDWDDKYILHPETISCDRMNAKVSNAPVC
jgi:hypothetical protein